MPNKLLERAVETVKKKKAERRLKKKAKRASKNRDKQKRRNRIKRNEPESAGEKAQATVRQGRRLAGELGAGRVSTAAKRAGDAAAGAGSNNNSVKSRRTVSVVYSPNKSKWVVRDDNGRDVSTHRKKSAAKRRAKRKVRKSDVFEQVNVTDKGAQGRSGAGGEASSDGGRNPTVPETLPFPGPGGGRERETGESSGSDDTASASVPETLPFPGPGGGEGQSSSADPPQPYVPGPPPRDAGGDTGQQKRRGPTGELPNPGNKDAAGPFEIKSFMGDGDDRDPPFF